MTRKLRKMSQHTLVIGGVMLWGVMEFVALNRAARSGRDEVAA